MRDSGAAEFHIAALDMFTKSVLAVVVVVFALIVSALIVAAIDAVYVRVRRAYRTWKVRRFLRQVARDRGRR